VTVSDKSMQLWSIHATVPRQSSVTTQVRQLYVVSLYDMLRPYRTTIVYFCL